MKIRLLLLSAIICFNGLSIANANLSLSEITTPKSPAYRIGISEVPENPFVQSNEKSEPVVKIKKQVRSSLSDNQISSYADLSIKNISKEIAYELECEEQEMISDLSLLWQGAAMQSDTINFALYKLANPDADKPDKSTVKNMLKTVASMSTLVGAGMSNPLLAGTSLIGANVLGIMGQDTKALNYKYSKVTDADMIILIRKVEDLQQKTVDLYYDYMNAKKQLDITTKLAQERKERFELAQKNNVSREIIVITDSHFRTSVDRQKTARSEFLSKRAALEQFVGNEAFNQFEKELALRENSLNGNEQITKEEYNNTVSNVESYTSNLSNSKTASLSGVGYPQDTEDKNLSKLNPVEELPQYAEQEQEQINEESAQDIAQISEKQNKKIKKEKQKKIKKDPYDTKGFIFLHDKQPDMNNYTDSDTQILENTLKEEKAKTKKSKKTDKKLKEVANELEKIDNAEIVNPQPEPKTTNFHGIDLLPLDEIKAPDLKPNGYSIFAR